MTFNQSFVYLMLNVDIKQIVLWLENQLIKSEGSVYTAQFLCFIFTELKTKSQLESDSRLRIPEFIDHCISSSAH